MMTRARGDAGVQKFCVCSCFFFFLPNIVCAPKEEIQRSCACACFFTEYTVVGVPNDESYAKRDDVTGFGSCLGEAHDFVLRRMKNSSEFPLTDPAPCYLMHPPFTPFFCKEGPSMTDNYSRV